MGARKGAEACGDQRGRAFRNEGKPTRSKACTSKGVEDEVEEVGDRGRDDEDQESMAREKDESVGRGREEAEGKGNGGGDEEVVGAEAEAQTLVAPWPGRAAGDALGYSLVAARREPVLRSRHQYRCRD